jgi:ABC-type cobalamin/Fe3+-siderophores transport system ATPase subunit
VDLMGAVSVAVLEVGNIVAIGEPKSVVEGDMLWSFYGAHPL